MYNRDKIIQTLRDIHEESKEIAPYVVFAQPRRTKKETPAQKIDGHSGLHIDVMGHSHGYVDIEGEKVDVARNYCIEAVLETDAKYLFFVGDDTVAPWYAFRELKKTCEENPNSIAVGVYYIKCSEAMIMVRQNNHVFVPDVSPGQVFEAWQTGMDCMLIPVDILRKMKAAEPDLPWCCIANGIEDIPFVGEDNFFVHRIRKHGVKLLVNTNVQCLHMDLLTGKYTAHPWVEDHKHHYYTNIKPTVPLTIDDKEYIDNRWINTLPEGTAAKPKFDLKKWIEEGKPVKFDMGCGQDAFEGYIRVDKNWPGVDIQIDVVEFTAPENCADEIQALHLIEHIPYFYVDGLLERWYKILKPGGKLVIEMPDCESLFEAFGSRTSEKERFWINMCVFGAAADYSGPEHYEKGTASPHLWGYWPDDMRQRLEKAGFTQIEELPVKGNHPGINFRMEATK